MEKPWENRYSNNPFANFNINETLYRTYASVANRFPDDIVLIIDDTQEAFTHRQFLNLVDITSEGFIKLGIGCGSKVGVILNGYLEDAITPLALNKIGAIAKYIDYMKSVSSIQHSIDETALDALIIDECFLPLEQAANVHSLPTIVGNASRDYCFGHYHNYPKGNDSIALSYAEAVKFDKDRPSIIISSSGTTGEPKPIVHSDYSINAAAQKTLYIDYPLSRGNVVLKMIPSQVGLGLINTLYTGLISGATVVMLSCCETDALIGKLVKLTKHFRDLVAKYGLNANAKLNVLTSPLFVRGLVKSSEEIDFSVLGSLMGGGSKMSKDELDDMTTFAKRRGLVCPICNGYGQNEMAGGPVAINSNLHNVNGSAGFPTYKTDIVVVDPTSYKKLGVNQTGLILESSNSEFLYYEGMPEQTKSAKVTLSDGTKWFNSLDLGYMNEDGFLFITGRLSRVVIREDHKVSLDEVEQKIRSFSFVEDCATVISEQGGSVESFVAYIVTSDEDAVSQLGASGNLHEYETPSEFIVVKELPYKSQGKIDYQKLQNIYRETHK